MGKPEIHPTACVDPGAEIGESCRIGPFAVVEEGTRIGRGTQIAAHATIKRFSKLGKDNLVCEGAVIGGLPQDFKFQNCESYVKIGDRNVLRECVTVNRSTAPGASTLIGNDCFLMAYSHVAHECELGDRVVMANAVQLAGHVTIGNRAFLSGGVVVHQFSRIGELAMVGGNAKVEKDVPPYCLVDGIPARLRGLNLVGLRRSGIVRETLQDLKLAYRLLISHESLEARLSQLAELRSDEAQRVATFVRNSQRGYCRPRD